MNDIEIDSVSYSSYSVTPEGKVWDYNATMDEWNILHHTSLSMSVRMYTLSIYFDQTLKHCINFVSAHFDITSPAETIIWEQGDWIEITWDSYHHTFKLR